MTVDRQRRLYFLVCTLEVDSCCAQEIEKSSEHDSSEAGPIS